MKKINVIVQARMGASRLPGKMLLNLRGLPIVDWVNKRVKSSLSVEQVVFAIPDTEANDMLAEHLQQSGALVYRGSETDVTSRFFFAALKYDTEVIVRVCADNPFVSGAEIDQLINFYLSMNYDYAYNHIPRNNNYPDGLGAEITSMKVLERIYNDAVLPEHREHVFNYIWDNQNIFSIGTFDPLDDELAHPELKLDIDTASDYERLQRLNVQPEMTAAEIINEALVTWKQEEYN